MDEERSWITRSLADITVNIKSRNYEISSTIIQEVWKYLGELNTEIAATPEIVDATIRLIETISAQLAASKAIAHFYEPVRLAGDRK